MIDILNIMQKYDIEPKRIRFVYPKMNRDSHVLLVEGMYKGKKGLKSNHHYMHIMMMEVTVMK